MSAAPPPSVREALKLIHPEVAGTYYGCGLVIPELVEGMRVLDLGSGSGRDCFVLSKLVGERGSVVGVDMTDEQLAIANRHIDYHTKAFGARSAPSVFSLSGRDVHSALIGLYHVLPPKWLSFVLFAENLAVSVTAFFVFLSLPFPASSDYLLLFLQATPSRT